MKNKLLIILFLLCVAASFTACSSGDSNKSEGDKFEDEIREEVSNWEVPSKIDTVNTSTRSDGTLNIYANIRYTLAPESDATVLISCAELATNLYDKYEKIENLTLECVSIENNTSFKLEYGRDENGEVSIITPEAAKENLTSYEEPNSNPSDDPIIQLINSVGKENNMLQNVDIVDLMDDDLLIGIDFLGENVKDVEAYPDIIAKAIFDNYSDINFLEILYTLPGFDVLEVDYERNGDSYIITFAGYDSGAPIG